MLHVVCAHEDGLLQSLGQAVEQHHHAYLARIVEVCRWLVEKDDRSLLGYSFCYHDLLLLSVRERMHLSLGECGDADPRQAFVHNLLVLLRESSPEARVRAAPHAHNLFSRHVLYAAVVGEHHAHHSCELRGAVLVKTSVNYRDAAS